MTAVMKRRACRQARVALTFAVSAAAAACAARVEPIDPGTFKAPAITLPLHEDSARFAVIGDSGTGGSAQYLVAARMISAHSVFPFEFVIMTGDNMYGSEGTSDYRNKFEIPYKPLLDAGVRFYASLGNHDDTNQIFYERFNMGGKRFYTFRPKGDLRFFALDSNYLTPEQLEWLDDELRRSTSRWKIAFFHHPLYSEGRHGSNVEARQELEPIFIAHGVDVVFVGHEHFYERIKPQRGVHDFTTGAAAKLRRGDIDREASFHAAGFDTGYHFMLVEIADDDLHFQVISDTGRTVDAGTIRRPPDPPGSKSTGNTRSTDARAATGSVARAARGVSPAAPRARAARVQPREDPPTYNTRPHASDSGVIAGLAVLRSPFRPDRAT